ncbi:Crp/Fnr family transcriptional regulator [Alcaligenaceae bacterium]|nr:Crp/Fnr family transcriptional regulator [Alcaligenaceae bacterium]
MEHCNHVPNEQHTEPLRELCVSLVPIFNHLPHNELVNIAAKAAMRTVGRNEFIHRAGEHSNQLYIVHQGKVKVYRLSEDGKEQLVRILQPGDFTGELALFSPGQHDSYAEATEDARVCIISRDDLSALMLEHPEIGMHLLSELAQRLGSSEKQTAAIATESINARIVLYLASLSEQAKSRDIRLPMSRKDLASYLGTSPETISRRLKEFEDEGWIVQTGQRGIRIHDLDALLLQ